MLSLSLIIVCRFFSTYCTVWYTVSSSCVTMSRSQSIIRQSVRGRRLSLTVAIGCALLLFATISAILNTTPIRYSLAFESTQLLLSNHSDVVVVDDAVLKTGKIGDLRLKEPNGTIKNVTLDLPLTKKDKPAIVMLISPHENDIQMAIEMFQSLDRYVTDNHNTPILIFNEGDLRKNQKEELQSATTRALFFPVVDFEDYPEGFNPVNETSLFSKRSKWGYQQMCRFWITRIWTQDILSNFTTIMRMDTDSCFLSRSSYPVPNFRSASTVYKANPINVLDSAKYTTGLKVFAQEYIRENTLTPKNPYLWQKVIATHARASFFSNFEIDRVYFFQREDVMKFQQAVTEKKPFGVFRHRWGDAVIRFLTLAIFATPNQVDLSGTRRYYGHGNSCPNINPRKIKAKRTRKPSMPNQ
jgi:hypothetical protein